MTYELYVKAIKPVNLQEGGKGVGGFQSQITLKFSISHASGRIFLTNHVKRRKHAKIIL